MPYSTLQPSSKLFCDSPFFVSSYIAYTACSVTGAGRSFNGVYPVVFFPFDGIERDVVLSLYAINN